MFSVSLSILLRILLRCNDFGVFYNVLLSERSLSLRKADRSDSAVEQPDATIVCWYGMQVALEEHVARQGLGVDTGVWA